MIAWLLISFFVLLFLGVPIAMSLGLSAMGGILFLGGGSTVTIAQRMFEGMNSFALLAIPLYTFAGFTMSKGGISKRLMDFCYSIVGHIYGGLAHVNVLSSMIFAGISGSAVADTAGVSGMFMPEMIRKGYSKNFTVAVTAISSTIGIIIPPSIPMVVIAGICGISTGKLFLGGIIPGILISLVIMLVNYIIAKKKGLVSEKPIPLSEAGHILRESVLALLMPFIILGGIYSGVFTATESAAVACLYGLIIGLFVYRTIRWKALCRIFVQTAENSALILFLMGTANFFGFLITTQQVPQHLAQFIIGFTDSKVLVMFLVLIMLLLLGTFLDNVAALVLFVPTMVGVVQALHIDMIFFGVFTIIALAVGQFTPPVGLNLFIASNIAQVKFESVVREIIPYLLAYVAMLVLFIAFPGMLTIFR